MEALFKLFSILLLIAGIYAKVNKEALSSKYEKILDNNNNVIFEKLNNNEINKNIINNNLSLNTSEISNIWSRINLNNQNNRYLSSANRAYNDVYRNLKVIEANFINHNEIKELMSKYNLNHNLQNAKKKKSHNSQIIAQAEKRALTKSVNYYRTQQSRRFDISSEELPYFIESTNHLVEVWNDTMLFLDKYRSTYELSIDNYKNPVRMNDIIQGKSYNKRKSNQTPSQLKDDPSRIEIYLSIQDDKTGIFEPWNQTFFPLWTEFIGENSIKDFSSSNILVRNQKTRCEQIASRNYEALEEGIFPCTLKKGPILESRICIANVDSTKHTFNITSFPFSFQLNETDSSELFWCSSLAQAASEDYIAISGFLLDKDPKTSQITKYFILGVGKIVDSKDLKEVWSWKKALSGVENSKTLPSPVISPNGSIICINLNGIYCFRSDNGSLILLNSIQNLDTSFSLHDDVLFIVEKQIKSDILHAFSTIDGKSLWKFDNATILSSPIFYQNNLYLSFSSLIDKVSGISKIEPKTGTEIWSIKTSYPILKPSGVSATISNIVVTSDSTFLFRVVFWDNNGLLASQIIISDYFEINNVQPQIIYIEDRKPIDNPKYQISHNLGSSINDYNVKCKIYIPGKDRVGLPTKNEYTIPNTEANEKYVSCTFDNNLPSSFFDQQLSIFIQLENDGTIISSNSLNVEIANIPKFNSQNVTGVPFGANISVQIIGNNFENHVGLPLFCKLYDQNSKGFIETIVPAKISSGNVECQTFTPKFNNLDESGKNVPVPTKLTIDYSNDGGLKYFSSQINYYIYPPFSVQIISPTLISTTSTSSIMIEGTGEFIREFNRSESIKCGFFFKSLLSFSAKAECNNAITEGVPIYRCYCHVESISSEKKSTKEPLSFFFSLNGQDYNDTSNTVSFFILPTINNVEPSSGPIEESKVLNITGTGFFSSTDLYCRFTFSKREQIVVGAIYKSPQNVSCTTPLPPYSAHLEDKKYKALVDVSLNGLDYTNTVTYTYSTVNCEDPTCSGRGTCNTKTGICDCQEGYSGIRCDKLNRQPFWWIIVGLFVFVTMGFLFMQCMFCLYFKRQSLSYKKVIKERKNNDISTVL